MRQILQLLDHCDNTANGLLGWMKAHISYCCRSGKWVDRQYQMHFKKLCYVWTAKLQVPSPILSTLDRTIDKVESSTNSEQKYMIISCACLYRTLTGCWRFITHSSKQSNRLRHPPNLLSIPWEGSCAVK